MRESRYYSTTIFKQRNFPISPVIVDISGSNPGVQTHDSGNAQNTRVIQRELRMVAECAT